MKGRRRRARGPRTVAVGGGKGGVGKTFISANLSASLAQAGARVVAVDTDLEGANLHTWLGIKKPSSTLADFVSGREETLESLIVETTLENLKLIPATQGHLTHAQPGSERRGKLLAAVQSLDCDLVILDCGAGTHASNVDYFAASDVAILVVQPEPTSLENAYNFLRSAIFRKMELAMLKPEVQACVREAMDQRNDLGIRTPADLRPLVKSIDPQEARRFNKVLREFMPRIIVNDVLTAEDVRLGFSISDVCKRVFGVEADYLGYVNSDEKVRIALRKGVPIVTSMPEADASIYLSRVARKLLSQMG